MSEELQVRVHGDASMPTLVYLPGLHGNWMLIGGFRNALGARARFVEITYPRTLEWTLDDYAAGVEAGLAEHGVRKGWLLAESFGSQVAWEMLGRKRFDADGLILAGGFGRHPYRPGARWIEALFGGLPFSLVVRILLSYGKMVRFRFRDSPETLGAVKEFVANLTELDYQAAKHRLRLVMGNDPRATIRQSSPPVYALSGLFDPIVPWFAVRPWLGRNCPGLRAYRIIRRADHNVLGTAAKVAAEQVIRWIGEGRGTRNDRGSEPERPAAGQHPGFGPA